MPSGLRAGNPKARGTQLLGWRSGWLAVLVDPPILVGRHLSWLGTGHGGGGGGDVSACGILKMRKLDMFVLAPPQPLSRWQNGWCDEIQRIE